MLASVDPAEIQLAFGRTWHLPFRWVSDPGGKRLARPLDAWDDEAGIFRPVVVAVAPDGREVFRELSRDFTDRPDDEPILAALESLDLPPLPFPPQAWQPSDVEPRPSDRAFRVSSFIPYFRAIRSHTTALAERMVDDRDREEVLLEHRMATSFLSAFDQWRTEHPPGRQ